MTQAPSSINQYIKWLRNAVSKPHLYDNDEFVKIKKELYQAEQVRSTLKNLEKSQQGFGYDATIPSEIGIGDSRSGEDDGVRSESIEPEQPGEPEGIGAA